MEKEFTERDMVEFANLYADTNITSGDVEQYRESVIAIEKKEFEMYLKLKEKFKDRDFN